MNILTILILSSMATAGMLEVFQKETCDLETCQRVEDAIDEFCDVNADDISIYLCYCDNIPDSFFQDFYDCAIGCGKYTEEDLPDPSSLRSLYCELASETELPSGYYDFTEGESDFEIGSETIDFDTETIDFDTQSDEFGIITETETTMTGPNSELRTRTSISKTDDSKTIKSGTMSGSETSNPGIINGHISINTGTTSSRTTSSDTSSSQTSSSETSSSQTSSSQTTSSESTTTVNGAGIINSGLLSCIALMLAMLI